MEEDGNMFSTFRHDLYYLELFLDMSTPLFESLFFTPSQFYSTTPFRLDPLERLGLLSFCIFPEAFFSSLLEKPRGQVRYQVYVYDLLV